MLEDRRLSAIAKLPPPHPSDDDEFDVVWSGKDSLSNMVTKDDAFELEFKRS